MAKVVSIRLAISPLFDLALGVMLVQIDSQYLIQCHQSLQVYPIGIWLPENVQS